MTSGKIRQEAKAEVTITFATPADALEWLDEARAKGALQHDAALFQKDGLDFTTAPGANQFIVRRDTDRPREMRVERQVHTTVTKGGD